MANGPLGGFMPTPPSPGQPPQVKLETSAESRGTFNKFLGTLPKNGAIAPIQTGVMQSSTAPVSPMTSNVNIFQPQMSQMTAMPMMPPAQPVQMMQEGGVADFGDFFDEVTSFADDDRSDFSSSDDNQQSFVDDDPVADFDFNVVTTPSVTEQEQQQNIQDAQTFMDTPLAPAPVIDTRPRTNIRNVGAGSNLRFDPQFTANLLQQRGLDPQGFMSPADFQQTTQGGATGTGQALTSGLPSLGLGQNLLSAKPTISRQDVLTAANRLSDIAPAATVPLAPASPFFDRDLLDDPLGLGIRTGFGPAVDAIEEGKARARATPRRGIQVAGSQTIVPGAGGTQDIPALDAFGGFGDPVRPVESIEDDLIAGRGKGTNINNPGNIRAGGGFEGEIGTTRDGFAIFDNLQSGVNAINTLTNTYGSKRNVDTVREYANRYSPVGENTAKEVAGKINVLSSALGVEPDDKVDFTDPNVQAKLTPAVMTTEIGPNKTRDVLNVLSGFSPTPLARDQVTNFNPNITTPVDQLGTLDPVGQTQTTSQIPDVLPDISQEFRQRDPRTFAPFISGTTQEGPGGRFTFSETPGRFLGSLAKRIQLSPDVYSEGSFDIGGTAPTLTSGLIGDNIIFPEFANLATTTQNISPENTAARIARNNRTINEIRADLGSRVPDTALETLQGARGLRPVQGPPKLPDQVFDIETITPEDDRLTTVSPDALTRIGLEQRVDDANRFRQTVPDAARIFGGRTIDTTPTTTTNLARGPQQSIVGDDEAFADLNLADIQGNINQQRVADILNNPKLGETFKIGDTEFPNLIATLANKAGSFFDRRLFDGIVSKGLDAVVDPDTGRIIGAKDEFGNLIEGRDLDQFQAGDDNQDPVTKFLKKATEEKDEEEDEKPPNVIGGTTPTEPTPRPPTVVKSTAPASTASFTPVGFDAGNLNDLIARITGVPTPRRLQDGGQVEAVDRFLSKVA